MEPFWPPEGKNKDVHYDYDDYRNWYFYWYRRPVFII